MSCHWVGGGGGWWLFSAQLHNDESENDKRTCLCRLCGWSKIKGYKASTVGIVLHRHTAHKPLVNISFVCVNLGVCACDVWSDMFPGLVLVI